jgi:hypothetical protein
MNYRHVYTPEERILNRVKREDLSILQREKFLTPCQGYAHPEPSGGEGK